MKILLVFLTVFLLSSCSKLPSKSFTKGHSAGVRRGCQRLILDLNLDPGLYRRCELYYNQSEQWWAEANE